MRRTIGLTLLGLLVSLIPSPVGAQWYSGNIAPPAFVVPAPFSGTYAVNNIVVTSTDGFVLQNTTPSTVGVPVQYGPRIRQCGTAWKVNATAASQIDCLMAEIRPASAGAATTFDYVWAGSINAGSYTDLLTLSSAGALSALGSLTSGAGASVNSGAHVSAAAAYYILWSGRSSMTSPADGIWLLRNNADTLNAYKNVTAVTESVTFRAAGAAETIAGNSSNFRITVGGTPGTTATVTFATAWTTAPVCHAQNEVTANILKAAGATGQVVLTGVVVAGDTVTVHCEGY